MNSLDVVTFGEAIAMFVAKDVGDLSQVHDFTRRVAGAELNVAIALARFGFRVGWVSRIGSDSFGRFICDVLDRERVDRQHVIIDPAFPTGFQLKSRGIRNQDPLVEYFRRGSAARHLSVADFDPEYFLSARQGGPASLRSMPR
jgi:2-dehydro-3-deoxygluconokinase